MFSKRNPSFSILTPFFSVASKQPDVILGSLIIFATDIEKIAGFYAEGLGLKIVAQNSRHIELRDMGSNSFIIHKVPS